jgi:hypothetical protein
VTTDSTLALVDRALSEHFGHAPVRASVAFVGVEAIEVLRFEPIPGERAYLSLGMSRHPMTSAAEVMQATDGPRAELMLHLDDPTDRFADVWRQVAILAASPAVEGIVLAPGMTVDLGQPLTSGSLCTGVLVTESSFEPVQSPGGPVEILLINPATPNELAWSRVKGAAALRERWADRGTDLLDLARSQVTLD